MSTAATKLLTAEEFYEWVHQPANADRNFELQQGEVIEMSPPGKYHGFVCANLSGILRNFAIQQNKGYVCTNDAGVIVVRRFAFVIMTNHLHLFFRTPESNLSVGMQTFLSVGKAIRGNRRCGERSGFIVRLPRTDCQSASAGREDGSHAGVFLADRA